MREQLEAWGLGEATITMVINYGMKVLGAILVLYLGFFIGKRVQVLIERRLLNREFDKSLTKFGANMARWTVIILAFLGCLSIFGVETTSFAAVIGGASVAIGLALQGSLSHVASGVMLLIFRPFTVGDVVNVAGVTGAVDEIGLFSVTIDTPDKRRIIIPNGKVFGDTIENVTHHPVRRVDVAVGVDYDADIETTREVLKASAAKLGEKLVADQPINAVLTGLGGSSVDWSVRVFCKTEDYWGVKDQLTRLVKEGLDDAEIGIPYPHQVIISQNA